MNNSDDLDLDLSEIESTQDLLILEVESLRKELEHLQEQSLHAIWQQVKQLNEHNKKIHNDNLELLNEIQFLRKRLPSLIARGVISASIILGLIIGLLQLCVAASYF